MNYYITNHIACIDTATYIKEYCKPETFIVYCESCRKFNKCWACPPFNKNPIPAMLEYKYIYIIGTKLRFKENYITQHQKGKPIEELLDSIMTSARLELDPKILRLEEYLSGRALFAGTCHYCSPSPCSRVNNTPCKYPQKVRPSLEAYGFDISKTTEQLLEIKLQWSNSNKLPNYLVLVSGLLVNNKSQFPIHFLT